MSKSAVSIRESDSAINVAKTSAPLSRSSTSFLPSMRLPLVAGSHSISNITKPLIQPKLKIGAPNDKYEQEADRVAERVMRMLEPSFSEDATEPLPKSHTNSGNDIIQRTGTPCSGEYSAADFVSELQSLHSGGYLLSQPERHFFEPRLGYDFSSVRVHTDRRAAALAHGLRARAFTLGHNIAFGKDQYQPHSSQGKRLMAHELTHVVQQGSGWPLGSIKPAIPPRHVGHGPYLQLSPLSDSLRATYAADPSLEAILARLAHSDIQAAQSDTDIDTELARLLARRPDDLWVAQQIRQGQLIENSGLYGPQTMPRNRIRVHYFSGTTNRRALVIAGVHGSEVQGIEVAQHLINDLQTGLTASPPRRPTFSVIVVPTLFPDNAARRRRERRGGSPTNRNFPFPTQTLPTTPRDRRGRPLAAPAKPAGMPRARATARPILTENILLLGLMERFRPERIISIHGTWRGGSAGAFYDPRHLTPAEERSARQYAQAMAYMSVLPERHHTPEGRRELREMERRFYYQRYWALRQQASRTDRSLSLRTARAIHTATASITGRERRQFANRETEPVRPVPRAQVTARRSFPSVAGNVGTSGQLDTAYWSGRVSTGYSLGQYASARGMSIFTVEPPINCTAADYGTGRRCRGRAAAVSQAERRTELMSYAQAIRTVLLG
jgi:hypothetical protein